MIAISISYSSLLSQPRRPNLVASWQLSQWVRAQPRGDGSFCGRPRKLAHALLDIARATAFHYRDHLEQVAALVVRELARNAQQRAVCVWVVPRYF